MTRLATFIETRIPLGMIPDFARAYALGVVGLPPELNQTFLLQSDVDPTVFRIHQYWLGGAAMADLTSPDYLRGCLDVLAAAGVLPATSSFVVLDHGHPRIGQRAPPP